MPKSLLNQSSILDNCASLFEDFETDGMFLTVKRQQPTLSNQRLFLRTLVGSRRGSLAEQHTIDLGGIGSLRGFDNKEFTGNRALTLSATYHFGGDVLQKIPLESIPWFGGLWSASLIATGIRLRKPRNGVDIHAQ